MKKFLLLFLSVCLGAAVTAQIPDLRTGKKAFNLPDKFITSKGTLAVSEKVDSTITETWVVSSWVSSGKKRYSYIVNGNTTTVTTQTRDASTAFLWVNSSKEEITVNTGGNLTLLISSDWNKTTSLWVPEIKMESSYDGTGKQTLEATYLWDTGISDWIGLSKTEFFYSGSNLNYDIGYDLDPSAVPAVWAKSSKSEYSYSGSNIIKEEIFEWDKSLTTPDWVKTKKWEFTYNAGNRVASQTSYIWDLSLSTLAWVNKYKFINTYDANGRITLEMGYVWNQDISPADWSELSMRENSWDASGRNTMQATYNWDKNIPGWRGSMKSETTYVTATINYSVTTGYSWLLIAWASTTRSTSYYSALTTGIGDKTMDKGVSVYPNPASEFITFSGIAGGSKVELINMNGAKVLEQRLSDNGMLSVGHLSKGVFIYRVYSNGLTYTGRVVLE